MLLSPQTVCCFNHATVVAKQSDVSEGAIIPTIESSSRLPAIVEESTSLSKSVLPDESGSTSGERQPANVIRVEGENHCDDGHVLFNTPVEQQPSSSSFARDREDNQQGFNDGPTGE